MIKLLDKNFQKAIALNICDSNINAVAKDLAVTLYPEKLPVMNIIHIINIYHYSTYSYLSLT